MKKPPLRGGLLSVAVRLTLSSDARAIPMTSSDLVLPAVAALAFAAGAFVQYASTRQRTIFSNRAWPLVRISKIPEYEQRRRRWPRIVAAVWGGFMLLGILGATLIPLLPTDWP